MKKIIHHLKTREGFLRIVLPIILVIVLILVVAFSLNHSKKLNPNEAKTKAETFVNTYLMQSGQKATIKNVVKEYGLYKMTIDITSGEVESYLTRDGKLFFPQALDIAKISQGKAATTDTKANAAAATPSATVSTKNSKPSVELFVMSYCPYGTQIEKGILPVLAALGNKIDFQLKFVDYSMHGQKELSENLTQYCIEKEQTAKLQDYLKCFLVGSDSATCLSQTGVNTSKLATCVSKTDKQFKITENATNNVGYQGSYPGFDINKTDNQKYNVGGSPTLVINGQQIDAARDSASLLKTICSAFTTTPSECNATLSSASPAPGFGTGTAASGSGAAGCGQ